MATQPAPRPASDPLTAAPVTGRIVVAGGTGFVGGNLREALAGLIAESPELAAAVVAGMTRRLTELQTLVEHLLVRDTTVRLAATLLTLAKGFGRPTADGMTAITLPLTHQALANMIGSNRVTVTRKLLEMQEAGLVRSLGRNALAVDPNKLHAHARAAETK